MEYIPLQNFSVPQIKTNANHSLVPKQQDIPKNTWIHTDPRICRGSVYAKPVITEDTERARLRLEQDQRSRRRVLQARVYNVSNSGRMMTMIGDLHMRLCVSHYLILFSVN